MVEKKTTTIIPDMAKIDAKLKIGVVILLILVAGAWYYTQPHPGMGISPGLTHSNGASSSGSTAPIVVQNDAQAAQELATASHGTIGASSSVDEALDLLSS